MTGGELLVARLAEQGVKRVFCVPGESYLAVLDALYDTDIRSIVARQVPLESALRRLILVAARDLPVVDRSAREREKGGGSKRKNKGKRGVVFALTDPPRLPDPAPRTCPDKRAPRIRYLNEPPPETASA